MDKLSGELFNLDNLEKDEIPKSTDDEINEKYKRGEIRIVTEQARYPVNTITTMLDSGSYELNPEYQRRKRWDLKKKSRLIESFIMNVPLPPIFLYEVDYSEYEVMDGLQRLTAIYDFYKGKYALNGLEYWKELNGKKYDELPSEVRKGIDRRYLSSIVLLQETAKSQEEAEELKQIVFERLNSGGEKLEPQETRNALYNGKFNQLCIKLAENDSFRKMWKIPLESDSEEELLNSEAYRKMVDVELVLRFFAYRFIDKLKGLTVEKFLDEYLKQANKFSDQTIKELEELFLSTVETVFEIFGEEAFLLPQIERKPTKPTKTVYDPLMQAVAMNIEKRDVLLKKAKSIRKDKFFDKKRIVDANGKKLFDGRYNLWGDVQSRIDYFNELLQKHIK